MTTPQPNMPPNGLVITKQFPPYPNLLIFAYLMREKLQLSKFNGNEKQDVAWFNKAEEYFEIYNIDDNDEKIKYVSLELEGNTYNWYMWWKKPYFSISWNTFKDDFFKRL